MPNKEKGFLSFLNRIAGKPRKPKFVSAVILAGGNSTRMGCDVSKQWLTLDGIPVIARTLLTFEKCELINEIVLVAKADELERYKTLKEQYAISKLSATVAGGEDRSASARNGFFAISDKATFVAIHDGARCLVTTDEIERVCRAAFTSDAAIAAVPVTDTVKIAASNRFVEKTVDRSTVWLAQTPQVFGTTLYHAATAIAERDKITVTDDSSLVEHIVHPVKIVECSPDNIKLTVPEDLSRARAILERRSKENAL